MFQSKLTCSIIGTVVAQEFFQINPDTCLITLRKSLMDDPNQNTIYDVCIISYVCMGILVTVKHYPWDYLLCELLWYIKW